MGSPSPARDRRGEAEKSIQSDRRERSRPVETRERSRDGDVRRRREEGEKSKVIRSRPGPVATMRLYSQSPSPPPELNQWRHRERRNEEREELIEVKVEEDHVVNAKPNNENPEKGKSDDSTNEDNEGDDDVMKKIKALKKVEKILQKELEARRKKRERGSSSDS